MSIWESIGLGVLQGLTEFFPVSSSGHLVIAQSFIEEFEQPGVLFDVMVHFGTMLAIVVFFRRELFAVLRACLPGDRPAGAEGLTSAAGRKLAGIIVIATVTTGFLGLMFQDRIYALFESVQTVSVALVVTGVLLFVSDRVRQGRRGLENMRSTDGIIIGLVQACALVPGISRSGSTIAAGIFLGLKGEAAARFSFLIAVPAILGATILELRHVSMVPFETIVVYSLGMVAAAVVGFATIALLMFVVSRRNLRYFAYYCWTLACVLCLANNL